MLLLSQRDPQWADKKMGASTLTIGRWGCTTTSISMLSSYFGCYKSPVELASNVHNYTADGLVLWGNMKFDKMKFERRAFGTTESLMAEIKEALKDPERGVVIQVNNGAHWVLGYSTKMFTNDIAVADPWQFPGKVVSCLKVYKNITGAAFYRRKSQEEVVVAQEVPKPTEPSKRLVKGDTSPEIFYWNGEERFHFPNWFTFVEFGGDMKNVETLPQYLVDNLPGSENITDIKPN